jgi:hypothetical protein
LRLRAGGLTLHDEATVSLRPEGAEVRVNCHVRFRGKNRIASLAAIDAKLTGHVSARQSVD